MSYINGLVSVVMPTYKRSDKLIRAIDSVLNQTYVNLELLLVNDNDPEDGYTKELKKRVEKYFNDSRFTLIIQDKHINGAVARNVGIKQAKGEFIAFLDDDDWWKKNKIEEQVKFLSNLDKTWGGVSCRIEQYDGDKLIYRLPKYSDGKVYKDVLFLRSDLATSTLLLRHEALDDTGYFAEDLLRHQDLQLLVNFSFKYKVKQLDMFLHCCDVSDTINRPNGDELLQHKKKFFKSVSSIMKTLSKKEQKSIKCVHSFEVGYVYFREKKYIKALKYFIPIITSASALKIITIKIVSKINSRKNG